jgi:hypothetical protein
MDEFRVAVSQDGYWETCELWWKNIHEHIFCNHTPSFDSDQTCQMIRHFYQTHYNASYDRTDRGWLTFEHPDDYVRMVLEWG